MSSIAQNEDLYTQINQFDIEDTVLFVIMVTISTIGIIFSVYRMPY